MQISQNPNLSQCSGSYEDLTDGPKYLKKKKREKVENQKKTKTLIRENIFISWTTRYNRLKYK